MVVVDFDGEDPLSENNLKIMFNWINQSIQDDRVIDAFGYAMHPIVGISENQVPDFSS